MADVVGPDFRRVQYTDKNRVGILGHGSVLLLTSQGNRTSPVLRGKWVMEVLMGSPPPPPPPNVPDLEVTGASKEGRMVYADGGTLFLDEVGDMPLATQAKLLRALETREVVPVGGNAAQKIDIRLVSATNRNLEEMVKDGRFREDLLYRLRVVELRLPPLRERKGDLTLLLDHFVQEFAKLHGRAVRAIQPEARAVLNRYEWPGNVRELRNVAENMVLLARGDVIGVEDLPDSVRGGGQAPSAGVELAGRSLVDMERELIRVNLELCGKNRERTAKILGIGERTLYRKIKEYGLE
jgi:two-component system response regulator HydG